jgi:hypothetical protein
MENADFDSAIMWREGEYRCELWKTGNGTELRVYTSDVLTYREPVLSGTGGLRQAAALLASVQAPMYSDSL